MNWQPPPDGNGVHHLRGNAVHRMKDGAGQSPFWALADVSRVHLAWIAVPASRKLTLNDELRTYCIAVLSVHE